MGMSCNYLSADVLQNVHAHGCLFDTYVAATVLSEAYLRSFHLPIASFAPKLGYDLVNLG
jgi:hypothetical protein